MKFSVKWKVVMGVSLVLMGCSGGGNDGGDQDINGLWRIMSLTLCGESSYDYHPGKYLEVTDGGFRNYQCNGAVCYYCPEHDAAWSGVLDTRNISVRGETMELTVNKDTACPFTLTLERANQATIQGVSVLENCNMITDEATWL